MPECDSEVLITRKPWPTRGHCAVKSVSYFSYLWYLNTKQYIISPHYLEISLSLVATAPVSTVSTTQRVTKLVLHLTLDTKQPDASSCANLIRIAQLIGFQLQYKVKL